MMKLFIARFMSNKRNQKDLANWQCLSKSNQLRQDGLESGFNFLKSNGKWSVFMNYDNSYNSSELEKKTFVIM